MHAGEYEFTIDSAHPDQSIIDTNFSELDPEHKSFNIIALDNGQVRCPTKQSSNLAR